MAFALKGQLESSPSNPWGSRGYSHLVLSGPESAYHGFCAVTTQVPVPRDDGRGECYVGAGGEGRNGVPAKTRWSASNAERPFLRAVLT